MTTIRVGHELRSRGAEIIDSAHSATRCACGGNRGKRRAWREPWEPTAKSIAHYQALISWIEPLAD